MFVVCEEDYNKLKAMTSKQPEMMKVDEQKVTEQIPAPPSPPLIIKKKYPCKHCSKEYAYKRDMKRHVKKIHAIVAPPPAKKKKDPFVCKINKWQTISMTD